MNTRPSSFWFLVRAGLFGFLLMLAGEKEKSFITTSMVGFAAPPLPEALSDEPSLRTPTIATTSAAIAAANANQLMSDRSSLFMEPSCGQAVGASRAGSTPG